VGGSYNYAGNAAIVGAGSCNIACGQVAGILSGACNTASGYYGGILGGCCNTISAYYASSFIVGSNLTAAAACTTYVNNLVVENGKGLTLGGCCLTAWPGSGGGVFVSDAGTCTTIRNGVTNCASGNFSAALSGCKNTASGYYAFVGSGYCNLANAANPTHPTSSVLSGHDNIADGAGGAVVVGGFANTACGHSTFVGGGNNNNVGGGSTFGPPGGSIMSGQQNTACGCFSTISSGYGNIASADFSVIVGGSQNFTPGVASFVGGGCSNWGCGNCSGILGGRQNDTSTYADAFIVGSCLTATAACTTFMNNACVAGNVAIPSGSRFTVNSIPLAYIPQALSLPGQVADITTTAFSGTNVAGLYRINYYLVATTADVTAGTVVLTLTYTDASGAQTITSSPVTLATAGGFAQQVLFVQVSGTGAISYAVAVTGIYATAAFDLYAVAEKLN